MMNYKPKSVFRDLYYLPYKNQFFKVSHNAKDDGDLIQRLGLIKKLEIHQGCVNTICWNSTGEYILSGSDDQHLVITNGHTYKVETRYSTSHHANIFSAKFLPCSGDKQIVSCSGDGIILHTDLENTKNTFYNQFSCHAGTTYEVITIPNDPNTFLSCGEDGTVRWFDLRSKTSCRQPRCKEDILVSCQRAITALAINPAAPHHLAVGCADSAVRIYDRRSLSTLPDEHLKAQPLCTFIAPNLEDRRYRITSLSYSADGQDMLVSYSSDYLYLFRVQEHKMVELMKKSSPKTSPWEKVKQLTGKRERLNHSPPPVRRLRLRGDWSDTGPDARPERDTTTTVSIGQARPQLHATLMQRMTDVLSQMLNDPMTRAALSAGGEDSLDPSEGTNNDQNQIGGNDQNESNRTDEERMDVEGGGRGGGEIPTTNENSSTDDSGGGGGSASAVVDAAPSSSSTTTEESQQQQQEMDTTTTTTTTTVAETTSTTTTSPSERPTEGSAYVNSLYCHLTTLRNLRDGFIEQHGAEPSVSLRYSQQSTANATISLRVDQPSVPSTSDENSSSQVKDETATTSETQNMGGDDGQSAPTTTTITNDQANSDVDFDYDDDDDYHSTSEPAECKKTDINYGYEAEMRMKYVGHRNARTMIKEATFWGNDYVMSGSDCGHVFIWEKNTAKLKMLLEADQHVVNCLQPHPTLPLLATSGIDHDVKLWAPILEESNFDAKMADDLINRNAIMLEETKDTITVPAAFMIRMLACLNQIRRGARARTRRPDDDDDTS